MNSLSWLMYFADMTPRLSGAVIFLCIVFGMLTLIMVSVYVNSLHESRCSYNLEFREGSVESHKKILVTSRSVILKTVPLLVVLLIIGVLIPSKQTVYLVAASEAGEMAVTGEYGQEVLEDLKAILAVQLKGLRGNNGS